MNLRKICRRFRCNAELLQKAKAKKIEGADGQDDFRQSQALIQRPLSVLQQGCHFDESLNWMVVPLIFPLYLFLSHGIERST